MSTASPLDVRTDLPLAIEPDEAVVGAASGRAVAIGPDLAGTSMTPEEFDAVTDWDEMYEYELIRGVLVVSPPTSVEERGPNELLGNLLFIYREQHPLGAAMDGTLPEHSVATPSGDRRRADRVIWAGLGRMPDPARDLPAIVVEFVSEGRRDRRRDYLEKRREYRAAGVREYWIIDRFRRAMTAIRRDEGTGPEERLAIRDGQTYATPLLPGFELPIARLFESADRWAGRG
jgi:Uma2 family endonuclease